MTELSSVWNVCSNSHHRFKSCSSLLSRLARRAWDNYGPASIYPEYVTKELVTYVSVYAL